MQAPLDWHTEKASLVLVIHMAEADHVKKSAHYTAAEFYRPSFAAVAAAPLPSLASVVAAAP